MSLKADISTIPFPAQAYSPNTPQAWAGTPNSDESILFVNQDLSNNVSLGFRPQIKPGDANTIPVPPSGSVTLPASRTVYAVAPPGTASLLVIPGGGAYFQGVTQGQGNLVLPSIHSPNFNFAAKTGWSIDKDGNAFFFNISASGDIFEYFPVPGPGNLVIALAGSSGVDSFSNPFNQGITVSQPGANRFMQIRPDLKAQLIYAA